MKKGTILLLSGLVPAVAVGALAPEPAIAPVEFLGNSVDLVPGLRVGVASDSNFYTEPAGQEDSSRVFTVNPYLKAHLGDDAQFAELQASVTGGSVSADGSDDFTDYQFGVAGQFMPAGNVTLSAILGTDQAHERRGSMRSENCIVGAVVPPGFVACAAGPDVFQDVTGNLAVTLGSAGSRGRATLALDASGRRYTSNGLLTDVLEYDLRGVALKFAWEVGGKTNALLEIERRSYDYLVGGSLPDSEDMEYLAGVEWDVTGKTTGYAKAGIAEKDFSDATRKDLSEPAMRLGVDWFPSDHNEVNLEMAKRFEESSIAGTTAKDVTDWTLSGRHQVNDRVEPWLRLAMGSADYQGLARNDDTTTIGLGVDYKFRRWVVLGAAFTRNVEESSAGAGALDFESNLFEITADMTL